MKLNKNIIAVSVIAMVSGLLVNAAEAKTLSKQDLDPQQISTLKRIYERFDGDTDKGRIMAKIGFCESSFRHIDPSTGSVNTGVNGNGSKDRGLFQINTVHDSALKELGLNVANEDDNMDFAEQLIKWRGNYKDWNSSRHCWQNLQLPSEDELQARGGVSG